MSTSFANETYYSINAFRFIDDAGKAWIVRWSFEPETPFEAIDKATLAARPANFLFDDVIARLARSPLRWHLIVTIAEPGDPTDDATKVWPADRSRIDVGTLVIDRALAEENGDCREHHFRPADPARPASRRPAIRCWRRARGAYASSLDATRRRARPAERLGRRPAGSGGHGHDSRPQRGSRWRSGCCTG